MVKFILAARPHPGEVLGGIELLSYPYRVSDDIVDDAQRQGPIEEISKERHDASKRAMTQQHQP